MSKSLEWIKAPISFRSLRNVTLEGDPRSSSALLLAGASYKEGSLSAADQCFSEGVGKEACIYKLMMRLASRQSHLQA